MLNLEAQGLEPKIDHKIESSYQIPFFVHKDNFWIIFSQQFILIFWPTEFDGLYYNIPCGKNFLKKQQVQPAIICLLSPLFQLTNCVAQRFWWNMIYIFKMNFITPSNVCLSLIHHYIHLHECTYTYYHKIVLTKVNNCLNIPNTENM